MKYQIQFAIERSAKKEDKTISKDALQAELAIPRHYEAEWLFSKAEKWHDTKLTWKQITEYLQKSIASKENIRDFFRDKQRDEEYMNNRAEKMENVIKGQERMWREMNSMKGNGERRVDGDSIGELRRSMEKRKTMSTEITRSQFGEVIGVDYGIEIGSGQLKRVWEILILGQNTMMNRTSSMIERNAAEPMNGLAVDFVVNHIVKKVPNHAVLSAKQILELMLIEIVLGDNGREDVPNAAELNRKMDKMLHQMRKLHTRCQPLTSTSPLMGLPALEDDSAEDIATEILPEFAMTRLQRTINKSSDDSMSSGHPPSCASCPVFVTPLTTKKM